MLRVTVSALLDAEVVLEQVTVLCPNYDVYLCGSPYVERAFFLHRAVVARERICVLRTEEAALGAAKVSRDVVDDINSHSLQGFVFNRIDRKELGEL